MQVYIKTHHLKKTSLISQKLKPSCLYHKIKYF